MSILGGGALVCDGLLGGLCLSGATLLDGRFCCWGASWEVELESLSDDELESLPEEELPEELLPDPVPVEDPVVVEFALLAD